ncbi:hypothetical protein ACYZUD_04225 [Pseudomonas sp. XS1P51]
MNIFGRIKAFIKQEPEEQIVGHSIRELKSIFSESLSKNDDSLSEYPRTTSLESVGVQAYYSSLLIDHEDSHKIFTLIKSSFNYTAEKTFNELPVKQYANTQKNEHLVFFTSSREFNSVTVRLVTNSVDFLVIIACEKFSVPPPWIVFEGYNPSWWGSDMQGAQGYYSENYFAPFFTNLSGAERKTYYARYNAADEWIKSLELMYDVK